MTVLADDYKALLQQVFSLIDQEISYYDKKNVEEDLIHMFPKFIIMYRFFRMLRGEAFYEVRPSTPQYQNDYYVYENSLLQALKRLAKKLDKNDPRVQTALEETKKIFSLPDTDK